MEIDLEICKTIAMRKGLSLQFVIKEFQVFDVLGQIAMETAASKELVFKGGTALNAVYLHDKQRFSEDLDFDLVDANVPQTVKYADKLAKTMTGFEIGEFRRVRQTVMFECSFESPLGGRDHVRVDICGKKLITANPIVIGSAKSTFTDRFVTGFYVYSFDDLVARKMNALRDRTEGKDVFDVYNSLPQCENILVAIEKALKSEGSDETVEQFLEETLSAVKKLNVKKASQLTNSFIPSPSRPRSWEELKNSLLMELQKILDQKIGKAKRA
ncbi:MAG: nucleotidyl transferase AbiEii/AbiGii toxin family protein [Candidatus Micrarchaeota archaeon]